MNIEVPGDKSIAQRAVILGAIADGISRLNNFPFSEDCLAVIRCIQALGVKIELNRKQNKVTIYGRGLFGLSKPKRALNAGESGTTSRMLAGILAAQPFSSVLTGTGTLLKRPMNRVIEPLCRMGAIISAKKNNFLPMRFFPTTNICKSRRIYGTLVPSAQVKSAMILCALYSDSPVTIIEPVPTRDHTERLLREMGISIIKRNNQVCLTPVRHITPINIGIPGDISSAAYFMAAALFRPQRRINIKNVGLNLYRTGIINIMRKMGARIKVEKRRNEKAEEPTGDITVKPYSLEAARIKAEPSFIDEIPLLAVMATQAKGTTVITNAQELKIKESNRLKAIGDGLRRMGANITETTDGLVINGPNKLKGAAVNSYNDHRIAMSLSIASIIASGKTIIKGQQCVNKSFPGFYRLLNRFINI